MLYLERRSTLELHAHAGGGVETPEETEQLMLKCMPAAQGLLQTAADHLRAHDGESGAPLAPVQGPHYIAPQHG